MAKLRNTRQPVLLLPTTQHPLSTNIQHLILIGRGPTPNSSPFSSSGPGVCVPAGGGGSSVLRETKGKRKKQAGKCWGHKGLEKLSECCTLLPSTLFLPWGILVKRDTQRWRPLVKLIKRPSKLDKQVLCSPENRLLGSGWQVPL